MGVTWATHDPGGAASPTGGTGLPLDPMLSSPSFTGGGSSSTLYIMEEGLAANLTTTDNCSLQLSHIDLSEAQDMAILGVLLIINVLVIAGNCLVIAAVFLSSKLRKVTNLFIVSLAVADLLLGMAVLPFSITVEVFKTWFFGDIWCSVWLAVDVWMSTASILNLCAISLDRF
ncbi:unnamed protein product, partial [Meganyctiphanes norvegica]